MKLTSFPKYLIFLAVLKGIFVMSLILSLFLWSIPILSFNSDIWLIFQKRTDVALDLKDVKSYNELITDFFIKGTKLDFLNQSEISHMQDVRKVLTGLGVIFTFSFIALLINFFYLSKSQKRFVIGMTRNISIGVFIVTLIVSILIMTNFDWTFLGFHKLVFVKNFIFPANSLLKILYPDRFFFGLSALYLLSVLVISLTVAIVSHRLKLK